MLRFAVYQKGKYRMIDNGKQGANWAFSAEESIFTAAAPQAAGAVRRIRALAGRKLRGKWQLNGSSRDMKAAYKQLPLDALQASLTIVIVYDVTCNQWRFAISHALLFGLSGAVLQFNRVPLLLVAIARRWFGIVCHSFFDDFRIIDFTSEDCSAVKWFDKLVKFMGWKV
jgi:hypothetical protein